MMMVRDFARLTMQRQLPFRFVEYMPSEIGAEHTKAGMQSRA